MRAGGTVAARAGSTARTRSTRMWASVGSKNLAENRVALPGDTRVAPPGGRAGSTTWTSAGSPAQAGPSYLSCTAEGCYGTKLD